MKEMRYPIDFVLLWVDDRNPEWLAERKKYALTDGRLIDDSEARYRDWGTLKYWFRGVEKYAPWVNRIFFVTSGHLPAWLNVDTNKLVHIKHEDYIPKDFLPTFSSHPIELCLNRIAELSEHFVYFNDDTFICQPVSPELFYREGRPVHQARLHAIRPGKIGAIMPHIYLNAVEVINEHFEFHEALKKNKRKWFSIRKNRMKIVLENYYCSLYQMFPGFGNEHLPVPILKSTMDEVWSLYSDRLSDACRHRFRDVRDVSQFVFRYWQLASGNFTPEKIERLGAHFTITSDRKEVMKYCDYVEHGRFPLLCLNDADRIDSEADFIWAKEQIIAAFEKLLSEKSEFEK